MGSKQGWENARRLLYICKTIGRRCRVDFLHSFIPAWRPPSFRSWVFTSLPCFYPFTGRALTWSKVFSETFSPSLFFFWAGGFLNQLPNRRPKHLLLAMRQSLLFTFEYHFTLQMNAFITNDKIVFVTHLQVWITLQMNTFIANDKHILCWWRIILVLETNVFGARDKRVQTGDEHFRWSL